MRVLGKKLWILWTFEKKFGKIRKIGVKTEKFKTHFPKSLGQFLKNKSQLFQGGLRGVPPTFFLFFFINSVNIYLGKVNECRDRVIRCN